MGEVNWFAAQPLATLLLAATTALAPPRSDLARDLVAFLKANGVDAKVVEQTEDDLVLDTGTDRQRIALENLEAYIANDISAGANPAEARTQVFRKYLGALKQVGQRPLTMAHDGDRIMPRLLLIGSLPPEKIVHAGKIGETGLELTYVLDSESSVTFLNASGVKTLGLDDASLRALAMTNLGRTLPPDSIRKMIESGSVNMIKMLDGFDAARLLLVQATLKKGESIAAIVPDRDTLLLVPVPVNGDWSTLRDMAKVPPGDAAHALLTRPLLVSPDKIEPK
jgi:hypothetical protein